MAPAGEGRLLLHKVHQPPPPRQSPRGGVLGVPPPPQWGPPRPAPSDPHAGHWKIKMIMKTIIKQRLL